MTATQDDTIAELQRTIAELRRDRHVCKVERDTALARQAALAEELAERTAELGRRNTEYSERIEHQAVTIDVLKAMSASPGDTQPVFDLIVRQARAQCNSAVAILYDYDGMIHCRSIVSSVLSNDALEDYVRLFPMTLEQEPNNAVTASIRDQRIVHIRDASAEPGVMSAFARSQGVQSGIAVPLIRAGRATGCIALTETRIGGYSDSQIELLKTFAEQAVIAITSAETYRALQTRTSDLQETLAYQTATSDVLKVISRSTFDLHPIFDTIVSTAARLCDADDGIITIREGDTYKLVTSFAAAREFDAVMKGRLFLVNRGSLTGRTALEGGVVHIPDIACDPEYTQTETLTLQKNRTMLGVPLLREGDVVGTINLGRLKVEPFSVRQIELVSTFADQAVIAIENTRLITEQREALEQQTATAEVLQVINSSPGDLAPVFDAMLEKAIRLCGGDRGVLWTIEGGRGRLAAARGLPAEFVALLRERGESGTNSPLQRVVQGEWLIEFPDTVEEFSRSGDPHAKGAVEAGVRSAIWVAIVKEGVTVGAFAIGRSVIGTFSDKQIALLQNFAAQAVIAMENARLLGELRERTAALAERNSEYGERIEHQAATIDVLKAMSASPGDPQPVFDLIVRRSKELCDGVIVGLLEFDGELVRLSAQDGANPAAFPAYAAQFPIKPTRESISCRAILDKQIVHIRDLDTEPGVQHLVRALGHKSQLSIPLLRDGAVIGAISLGLAKSGGFSNAQIALLQTFAEQAVITLDTVATYRALRERTEALARSVSELRALEEVLRAVNSSLDLQTVLATIISRAVQLSEADEGTIYEFDESEEVFVPKAAFGMTAERVEWLRERKVRLGETHLGRSAVLRAPVHIDDVQQDPTMADASGLLRGIHAVLAVPLLREDKVVGGLVIRRRTAGGFAPTIPTLLQTFAGQAVLAIENAQLFQDARWARTTAEAALVDLRRAQDRLVQSEKMASLGQLTAGIAHEIKNPLNFVNNFAALSVDLLSELKETAAPGFAALTDDQRAEVEDISAMLTSNLEKINEHGKRADGIVKAMLEHSRGSSGERRMVDLNAVIDEALNLAYHGARAQDQSFNITLERDFGEGIAPIEVNPQDITRVFLNLFSNGFYATTKRARDGGDAGFVPTLKVTTRDAGEAVEIRVRDNGTGIPADIRDKLFQPFFTTKPTGEGTGLGLSITYDIVTQQHGGSIAVDSKVGDYSEFTVRLPRGILANEGGRA